METPSELHDWAALLARNWQARATLPTRDLFVASHPGWNDAAAWERHARTELELFLTDLDPQALAQSDVLEIGCGSGRLVPFLRPLVRSYTGFDIAAAMVQAAAERCRDLAGARFLLGDGLQVPAAACDRRYHLAIACAVFIHCPRAVIASNVRSAFSQLHPGGELRLQLLADPADPTGIEATTAVADAAKEALQRDAEGSMLQLGPEELRLVTQTYYMGERFRYDDVKPFLRELTDADVRLYRGDVGAIYARVVKRG